MVSLSDLENGMTTAQRYEKKSGSHDKSCVPYLHPRSSISSEKTSHVVFLIHDAASTLPNGVGPTLAGNFFFFLFIILELERIMFCKI